MPIRILAIDDCPDACSQYRLILRQEGYRVKAVDNGFDALAELEQRKPDLLLLEVAMHGLSGWDTLRIIRGTAGWEDIPVLVVTDLANVKKVSQGHKLGCTHYVQKPFDPGVLLTAVEDVLSEAGHPAFAASM